MAGIITMSFKVIKNGQSLMGMTNGKSPLYIPGPVQPQFAPSRMLYFEVSFSIVTELVYPMLFGSSSTPVE